MNLIDGLDGLAGGVGLLACVGYLMLPGLGLPERMVAVSLAGALLGFLWFNLHPALIFMGDAGSLFAGVVVAALAMHPPTGVAAGWFPLMPMLLLAVPLGDTSHAIGRRLLAAARDAQSPWAFLRSAPRRMFTADRGHVHHLLQAAGFSPRRAAALLWAAAFSFVVTASSFARGPALGVVTAVAVLSAWSWVGWRVSLRLARSPITPSIVPVVPIPAHDEEPARESARAA
jgi:UDP-GlcNAc:undecaprenyl-phosphate GlcNAc-1-phosphate transferase